MSISLPAHRLAGLDLSIGVPHPGGVDEFEVLRRHPGLGDFRAALGDTPLLEVPGSPGGARILAKHEMNNPMGSVKDRVAYGLLCDAVARHEGPHPLSLVDFSGGNMARALGRLGRLAGIPVRFAVPDTIPPSWLDTLAADGVMIDKVDAADFIAGIIARALDIAREEPGWTVLQQHRNMANLAVHEHGTGAEIVAQLGRTVPACWVAAIGTGGTIAGVARALRRAFPAIRVVGVTPAEMPYGTSEQPNGQRKIAGSGGLGFGMRQPFVDAFAHDAQHRGISLTDALHSMAEFRSLTGYRIGTSAAANWIVAREVAATLDATDTVVTLFPDAGTVEDWVRVDELGEQVRS